MKTEKKSTLSERLGRLKSIRSELPTFRHHHLNAYEQALKVAVLADALDKSLPSGQGKIRDQLRRAASGLPLLISEGSYRRSKAQKRQRYDEALAETGEVAAAAELTICLDIGDADIAVKLVQSADRLARQLTGLCKKYSG